MVQLSHPYRTTGKTIVLTRQTFVSKVMSLLFNTLFRFVITFLPRSKCLLISWLQSSSTVFLESKKIVCHCFHLFPHLFAMKWWDWMPWSSFFECCFKPAFYSPLLPSSRGSLSAFVLSAIRVVSSAYLRLLIFLPAILIPAWASSSLAFCIMYSAYKLMNFFTV